MSTSAGNSCGSRDVFVAAFAPTAVVLSGGPESVTEPGSPRAPQGLFERGVPILGICYGEQTIAAQLGGAVEKGKEGGAEFGRAEIEIVRENNEPRAEFSGAMQELMESRGVGRFWISMAHCRAFATATSIAAKG